MWKAEYYLSRALLIDVESRILPTNTPFSLGGTFQLRKPPAQISPQFVSALVFGNGAYQFFEAFDLFRR